MCVCVYEGLWSEFGENEKPLPPNSIEYCEIWTGKVIGAYD